MSEELRPNEGKQASITIDGCTYLRLPITTHLITKDDDILDVVEKYGKPLLQEGDILFVSEKIVACSQGRAIPLKDIKPRKLAYTLSKYVTKTPAGIGLGIPETMEMALQECGTLRILFAAFCSVIGKLLEMIYNGEVVSRAACDEMIDMMLAQQCTNKIPLLLPGEGRAAHKTGEDDGITHDTGIIYAKKPFIVCFCNWQLPEGDEGKMNVMIGQITRELWDAMGGDPERE